MFWRDDVDSKLSKEKANGIYQLSFHLASPLVRPLNPSILEACGLKPIEKQLEELQKIQKRIESIKDKNRNLNVQKENRR